MHANTETPAADARERRDIVTPYAFQVHPRLLGLPLAPPWRRALAIALDGIAVGMLSQVPDSLLALVTGLVLFRWAGSTRHPKALRWRGSLRGGAGLLMLLGVFGLMSGARVDRGEVHLGAKELALGAVQSAEVARLAIAIEKGDCRDAACARGPLLRFAELAAAQPDLKDADAWDAAAGIIENLHLGPEQLAPLRKDFLQEFQAAHKRRSDAAAKPADTQGAGAKTGAAVHSLIEWAKGLLDDLGIGLGWAALYFSVFSAWWNGQTPGKKLLGIRVVQLDGTPISLWEAFERYGGYGAGFATGLLGFMQVWWDPNRQAIHDKIAETVVIAGDVPADIQQDLPTQVL